MMCRQLERTRTEVMARSVGKEIRNGGVLVIWIGQGYRGIDRSHDLGKNPSGSHRSRRRDASFHNKNPFTLPSENGYSGGRTRSGIGLKMDVTLLYRICSLAGS